MKNKVLIIDDDKDLNKILKKYLEINNLEVICVLDGKEGLAEALKNDYTIIILDVMLPNLNGFDVLRELRKKKNTPILMLTAKDSEADKISGLRMGADDYITKPFSTDEFIARVQSLIRRFTLYTSQQNAKTGYSFNSIEIDITTRIVKKHNKEIELTCKEFDLLYFLIKNNNKVFTKQQIYRNVWNEEYAFDDNNIMVHIRRLRKKIENDPENPTYIKTVWGVGYKFEGEKKC
jgi:DNA-binding response OmpR family regulator